MKTYNGVPLDGRPMSIAVATSEIPQAPIRKTPSFGTSRPRGSPRSKGAPGNNLNFNLRTFFHNFIIAGRRFGAGGGGRGSARGAPRGGGKKQELSIDQLNAELDAYTMQA
jgi:THO complex subunit 4